MMWGNPKLPRAPLPSCNHLPIPKSTTPAADIADIPNHASSYLRFLQISAFYYSFDLKNLCTSIFNIQASLNPESTHHECQKIHPL